jgi:hypothetical protein
VPIAIALILIMLELENRLNESKGYHKNVDKYRDYTILYNFFNSIEFIKILKIGKELFRIFLNIIVRDFKAGKHVEGNLTGAAGNCNVIPMSYREACGNRCLISVPCTG